MKKLFFLFSALLVCGTMVAQSQGQEEEKLEYRRNSLATLMVFHPEDEFCQDIWTAFNNIPFPDKYDEHNMDIRCLDFNSFYGLKKKGETYAFRSQDASILESNTAVYNQLCSQSAIFESPSYVQFYLNAISAMTGVELVLGDPDLTEKLSQIQLTQSQQNSLPKMGLAKAKYGKKLSKKEIETNALAIEKMLNENQCGKRMVARWFGFQGDSVNDATFNTDLVVYRGNYNATEFDVALADQSARGRALLGDAGEELIGNTFIIVNDITYVTAEEKAAAAKTSVAIFGAIVDVTLSILGGGKSTVGADLAKATAAIADSFTGFNVKTHSYLYQLVWDDETAATFYKMHYTDQPDSAKVADFLADNATYKVKYVAHEYEFNEKSTFKGKYDRQDLVKLVATRSMDKNIASLQKKYEDFKVKTPVYEVFRTARGEMCTAKIGLKEGITEKSKFQVVRRQINPQTGKTVYKYVGVVKPVKGSVWDNRFMATEEREKGADLTATKFRKISGGEILSGMLLIEGKYKKVQQ